MQMALHHEFVSVEPRALREAVEARWLAFRERPAAASARTSVPSVGPNAITAPGHSNASTSAAPRAAPKAGVVAMGESPKAMSWWEATKIIILLIGIAIVLRIELSTSPLPMECSTTELRQHARYRGESA